RGFYHIVRGLDDRDVLAARSRAKVSAKEFVERIRALEDSEGVLRKLLFCEFLPGREITTVGFVSPSGARTFLPFERLSPGADGVSTHNILHPSSIIEKVMDALLRELPNLYFYVDIQVKQAATGQWKVIDVNPRISGLIACC